MKVKKILSGLIGLSMLVFSLPVFANITASAENFNDVENTNPNYTAIMDLKARGIIQGYPDGSFKPNQIIKRAEALKIVLLGSGVEVPDSETVPFKDVSRTAWYAKFVVKAKELMIIKGYPDNTFKGDKSVNLVENLKMLILAKQIELEDFDRPDPYNDAFANQWYSMYVNFAKDHNLIDADNQNNIHPDQGMTRGKLAETMYRLIYIQERGLQSFPKTTSNTFNFNTLKIGDTVGGMKVTTIEKANTQNALSINNTKITFEGQAKIKGNYTYYNQDDPFLAGQICIEPESFDNSLPTLIGGSNTLTICFNNKSLASDFFAPQGSEGIAEITIDHYSIVSLPAEVWNTADFVKLINKTQKQAPTPETKINIMDMAFLSGSQTVTLGTTVTWTNKDQVAHTVTSDSNGTPLNSQTLNNGQTYSFTFTKAGTYNYHCSLHQNMKGTIVVTPIATQ